MTWAGHNYGLKGDALTVAKLAVQRYPWTWVTSGRRTREEQAAAMAENENDRPGWIDETYADSTPKRALVAWRKAHRFETCATMITAFVGILRTFSDDDLRALTAHANGEAFDLHPELRQLRPGEAAEYTQTNNDGTRWTLTERAMLVATLLRQQAIARAGRFLVVEGGLIRLHWQAARGR